jgi:hypothetical protein
MNRRAFLKSLGLAAGAAVVAPSAAVVMADPGMVCVVHAIEKIAAMDASHFGSRLWRGLASIQESDGVCRVRKYWAFYEDEPGCSVEDHLARVEKQLINSFAGDGIHISRFEYPRPQDLGEGWGIQVA